MSFQIFITTKILFSKWQLDNLYAQKMPGKNAMIVIYNEKSTKVKGLLRINIACYRVLFTERLEVGGKAAKLIGEER